MKLVLFLSVMLVVCFADSGYYDIISYCDSNCPKTAMQCPVAGAKVGKWDRNSNGEILF